MTLNNDFLQTEKKIVVLSLENVFRSDVTLSGENKFFQKFTRAVNFHIFIYTLI